MPLEKHQGAGSECDHVTVLPCIPGCMCVCTGDIRSL